MFKNGSLKYNEHFIIKGLRKFKSLNMKKIDFILKKICISILISLFITTAYTGVPAPVTDVFNGGRGISFNDSWKFQKGDVSDANNVNFNDSSWQKLFLPHDWSIEQSFNQNSSAGSGGGYLDGGIGWYRKIFYLPQSDSGKRITIQFEGIYMNSTVWINGQLMGTRPYGYSTFEYDITPYVNIGSTPNVIAVKVNNNQPNSRWYSGSGIYRNVWLTVTNPVHIAYCGTFISTSSVSGSFANVSATTWVQNQSDSIQKITVVTTIYDNSGNGVATSSSSPVNIEPNTETALGLNLNIANPNLWSISNPYLYTVKTQIFINKTIVDNFVSILGIRSISINPNTGFWLNDTNIKLHGVCMHHDLGSLGSAQNYRALERQVEILKSFGCNAIRTSHNPPAPELLDICDKLGLVVMDEAFDCWEIGKTANDYHLYFDAWAQQDVQDWIRRDRNHPSVVMWSIGNEIPEQAEPSGYTLAQKLISWVHSDDLTRPITQALNTQYLIGPLLNIVGYNYASGGTYDNDHSSNPKWVIMGSETSSAVRTRGVYHLPTNQNILTATDMQCSSYDNSVVPWGNSAEDSWTFDKIRPFVVGQFIWTGFDYIGEPTPYPWPAKSSYFGIVDMAGFPKDIYYFYQSQWTSKPMVHLLPYWSWPVGDTIPVWAYSNCDSVSLFLNGISLGSKKLQTQEPYHLEWKVAFTDGKVKALAYKNGTVVASDSITTAITASIIGLKADRDTIQADGYDQAFIETDILDTNGTLVSDANNQVKYSITGPGKIVGVDNGNPISLESFKDSTRQAFNGKCLAIVQSTGVEGQIVLTATTPPVLKNLALNKPSHADSENIYALTDIAVGKNSTADSQQGGNPASAGNDGNIQTRWCANDDNTGHWWEVDLGANHNIIGTEIYWEHVNAYQYKIETSLDNSIWKLAVNKMSNSVSLQTMDDNFIDTARYIRITITGGLNGSNWASFFEFRVFDGTVSISSQKDIASNGNDGNLNSYWSAADGDTGHFWVVDLTSDFNLTGSQVVWVDSGVAYEYKIETSLDSSIWHLAIDKTNNTSILQTQTDSFNVTARYVRITITGGTSSTNKAGFYEFRLFDGSTTTFTPASVTINCVKPICTTCQIDSTQIKPWVNINNTGWQQSGSALLCAGGNVSFSPLATDTSDWSWNGPNGYSANTMQINLKKVQTKDTGIYKATHKNLFFNFYLNLVKDSISPFIKINNSPLRQVDTATVLINDTISLSPLPPDSVGWTWSWTGPNGFSATSRVVKFAITDINQTGTYTSNGSDGFDCGNASQIFKVAVKKTTGISGIELTQNLDIYPNPSNDGIFMLKNCNNCAISVYNLMGDLVFSTISSSNPQVLDLSLQAKGIYIIRIFSNKMNSYKKLVNQ
jgi:beta-galactosidase